VLAGLERVPVEIEVSHDLISTRVAAVGLCLFSHCGVSGRSFCGCGVSEAIEGVVNFAVRNAAWTEAM